MCSNAVFTVVVPAPEDPVTTTIGFCLDMMRLLSVLLVYERRSDFLSADAESSICNNK
jgi:hypothetical protein